MKKLSVIVFFAGSLLLISCGQSAEEKAAADKARQDSLNNVEMQRVKDSIETANKMAKMVEDSINTAKQKQLEDSLANLSNKMKIIQQKAKQTQKQQEQIKKETEQQVKRKG